MSLGLVTFRPGAVVVEPVAEFVLVWPGANEAVVVDSPLATWPGGGAVVAVVTDGIVTSVAVVVDPGRSAAVRAGGGEGQHADHDKRHPATRHGETVEAAAGHAERAGRALDQLAARGYSARSASGGWNDCQPFSVWASRSATT